MPQLVAVTGASGFIGRRLVAGLLAAGYDVRALIRRAPVDDVAGQVSWITGSLSDPAALTALVKDASAVIHCAGAIKAFGRDAFLEINRDGTRRLADAAAAEKTPPRFVYLSSLAARHPLLSDYAASKRAGEQVIRGFGERLRSVILRPPAVYGPGDMETLRIFQMAAKGVVLAPSGTGHRTSLVHVDDAVGAILAALRLDHDPPRPIEFDDGRPGGYTWPEIAAAAGQALRNQPRVVRLPSPAFYAAGAVGSLHARLTGRPSVLGWGKVAELLHPDWAAETSDFPGYRSVWTIEKGFKDAVSWYASRGLLKSNG